MDLLSNESAIQDMTACVMAKRFANEQARAGASNHVTSRVAALDKRAAQQCRAVTQRRKATTDEPPSSLTPDGKPNSSEANVFSSAAPSCDLKVKATGPATAFLMPGCMHLSRWAHLFGDGGMAKSLCCHIVLGIWCFDYCPRAAFPSGFCYRGCGHRASPAAKR